MFSHRTARRLQLAGVVAAAVAILLALSVPGPRGTVLTVLIGGAVLALVLPAVIRTGA